MYKMFEGMRAKKKIKTKGRKMKDVSELLGPCCRYVSHPLAMKRKTLCPESRYLGFFEG